MLLCKRPAIFFSLAVLLTSLTACTNAPTAKNLEQSLAADPRLKKNPVVLGQSPADKSASGQNEPSVQLPADFPKDIPIYPNAKLEEITPVSSTDKRVLTRWLSSDPSNIITSFYRNQFQSNDWQILQQPTDDVEGSFEVRRNDLLVKVSIQPQSVTNPAPNQPQTSTLLKIEYVPNDKATSATNNIPPAQATQSPGTSETLTAQEFSDLNKVSQPIKQYIQDLAELGVFSADSSNNKTNSTTTTNEFEASKIITRREYARWLMTTNNAMYANNPAKQIRPASESVQPTFSDVSPQDLDFPAIQGLAEAGLIPSPLSGDSTAVLFRPDAPLTREQLVLWKVPLDTRQALPNANLEAVKETWGFQDVGKIDPKSLRAVLADFQNGEQSNIRRVFGYTTLFQPKKPVTRAEAAAALWYFGTQGEGISATEALKLKRSP
ncbi:S-layer homology domain-containing protein [Anabaena sp. UHCC 0399]|uniref:S-layer homology domain-containing protein n=1 Tax=Anabaena sp. UHCC 0399 TaxID=3110238 RepID=UPI002B1FB92A|nr:S-layer homology domain-containing protein [Anabaena sp. UHCC 0399]MEA5566437.1 S-layer homology domain-containing protein [Anabaena sp. UHCC 0399]